MDNTNENLSIEIENESLKYSPTGKGNTSTILYPYLTTNKIRPIITPDIDNDDMSE